MDDFKLIAGIIAAMLAVAATIPYTITILRGQTKPHLFSWVVWSILSAIAFSAQLAGGAGSGAWVTGVSAVMSLAVACMAFHRYHEIEVNRADWIAFIAALAGIPLWLITDQPLYAALLVTAVSLVAYIPTMRKSWNKPYSENWLSYTFHLLKCLVGISAMAEVNLVTALYPAAFAFANIGMITIIVWRRTRM